LDFDRTLNKDRIGGSRAGRRVLFDPFELQLFPPTSIRPQRATESE
jgi:hypothetical protein